MKYNKAKMIFFGGVFKNALNFGVDLGLKALLPDLIEDQVIDIKNSILEGGFKEGVNTLMKKVNEFKNSITGIFTGNFNNIEEIHTATKQGGIIKTVSKGLSKGIDAGVKSGAIPKSVGSIIKAGKTTILNEFNSSLESQMKKEMKKFDTLNMLHLNKGISELSIDISKKDNSLDPADILIGATGVYYDLPVYTHNLKHFKLIKGITLYNEK